MDDENMRETMERVAREDFYESRGKQAPEIAAVTKEECFCCPGGISRGDARCMKWRRAHGFDRLKHFKAQAGRYPDGPQFPCELCGETKPHIH